MDHMGLTALGAPVWTLHPDLWAHVFCPVWRGASELLSTRQACVVSQWHSL